MATRARLVSARPADTRELQAEFERAERGRVEAAEAEQAAYQRWLDAYAAYEIAQDDASAAWRAWAECTGAGSRGAQPAGPGTAIS